MTRFLLKVCFISKRPHTAEKMRKQRNGAEFIERTNCGAVDVKCMIIRNKTKTKSGGNDCFLATA